MIAASDVAPSQTYELRGCGLAALAEAGVVFVPVALLLSEVRPGGLGVRTLALPFVAVYVAGALLACRFRESSGVPTTAAVAAVLAGVLLGGGALADTAFAVVIALLVALRVLTLAGRDWRTPIHAEIGWGAAALGFEALLAGALPEWRLFLVVFVPVFFGASLASRAVTVWAGTGEPLGREWVRRSLLAAGALAVAMALAVVLGVRGGVFDLLGRLVRPVAEVVGGAVLWVIIQAARPLFWLADRAGFDPERVREFFERLRQSVVGARGPVELHPPDPAPWARVVGLVVFVALGYALYRLLHRVRAEPTPRPDRPPPRAPAPPSVPVAASDRVSRPWFRRELPSDAVRRMYAEVLLDLRARQVVKEPSLTPAEFVPIVSAEFPSSGDDFRVLTRSYEHVRYGSIRPNRDTLGDLERRHRRLRARFAKPDPSVSREAGRMPDS